MPVFEKMFYLMISIKAFIRNDIKGTKKQLEDIHLRITTGDKIIEDYSPMIQHCYQRYLEFLNIKNSTI